MHNFTLGWTSDDGPNVFCVGWLSRIVITFTPGGGGGDALLKIRRLRRKTQRNVRHLMNLITLMLIIEENDDR